MVNRLVVFTILLAFVLSGCSSVYGQGQVHKVGMLVENTIHDQVWGQKGYKGLLDIKEELGVDVYFKERVRTDEEVRKAVQEFADKGVNLIFGHSATFGPYFEQLQEAYPDVRFVYFNGNQQGEQMTSLTFEGHAMGFFGGMVAGEMTESNQIGVIAAYEWQPEVEGFYEGVKHQNPEAEVNIQYVHSWEDQERALMLHDRMTKDGTDVFYPAGDGFNVPVIERIKHEGQYAIGYVSDQANLGKSTVLTSTIQHVDRLYLLAAKRYDEGELPTGILTFDFEDEVISLGTFSPVVPKAFTKEITNSIERYRDTGALPNE
ncbi:transcriptional regulator [Pontibacillus halophilus JSM 076056 = DSM 19796]|uniref:Transcriptional regulator n=1 Tax=Pontibacillus halophilus JSM 076056 = DSM 19796 TaxID=1385510 RepID=A0A0A5GHD6_9BACI|nr:BMP family ABC transporter substrate-binding protein [Pontibacillus halophilus]KGX92681.1 transcriptional regulator [Pontibacillus halophilus JSM 076056 = DSM 19796]